MQPYTRMCLYMSSNQSDSMGIEGSFVKIMHTIKQDPKTWNFTAGAEGGGLSVTGGLARQNTINNVLRRTLIMVTIATCIGFCSVKKGGISYVHSYFVKVAILTFWFNPSSSNLVERQRSEARGIPTNLTYHNQAPCRLPRLVSHFCLASLSLRSAFAKPDAAYFSAALNRPPRSKRRLGDRLIR